MSPPAFPDADGAAPALTITERTHATIVVLHLAGDLDLTTADRFQQIATTALAGVPPVLVLDLTDVAFLASAGLSALVATHLAAAAQHTPLRVVAASRLTRRPIELTGLADVLAVFPDLATALSTP